jgi:type I restriction enzyme S subunit
VEETQYGTSLKANEQGAGVPVLRMNNITYSGALDLTDMKHVEMPGEDFEQYSVRRGDLLFNRTNSQELVGKMGVWNRDEQVAFAGYLVRLRLKPDSADPAFVGAWFNTPEMKALLRTRAKPSINMSNINATEVLKFPVVLPPLAEQRRIAEVLDRAEALRAKRRAALAQLDSLNQSLFLDLFGDPATNPKGWAIRVIRDLLESASYGTSEKSGATGEFPVLRMNNISRTGEIDFTDLKFMDLEASQHDRYLVRTGDVLFNRTNSVDLVGKTAVCREMKPVAYAGYLIRLRVTKENHPEFLSAFLNSGYSKAMLRGMCKSIIGMANINATEIQNMKIPHPPLELQREFARRVTAVEALKTAQRASLAELDALLATLQHRAFRGEL